ncbi:hypothetical protein MKX67_10680 [Cytobacillus sp. FSL W7-1323]|uniref:Uncharacterized protein n=1 Tax=Cytobacillus kochii TaxID=859143 RepID=A0A248TCH1_9BACI|nr:MULTISPECIES: hypothetical protein [Cytobacillus]ASV65849.1 hypothetical protein CKF48_00050 [Cytobacillus kochii]MDQ0184713.1 hypothetical protein [Cytobacillus kochii]MEA1852070.1 hypothetical protein [Cytobacillus sp. OWB-43]MED1606599.1 hypothetical protein [Cytobacillus kochii]
MKRVRLLKDYQNFQKGTPFLVITESEFIGVKEYVLRTYDLHHRLLITDKEYATLFSQIGKNEPLL